MARNIAAMSSGFKNLSTQVEASLASPKVKITTPSIYPTTPPTPTGTSKVPLSAPVSTLPALLPQLDHAMYGSVMHWDEGKYQDIRKGGKGSGEDDLKKELKGSVLSCYMEDENGNKVPENTRKAIRKRAKGLFNQLLQGGVAPATWGGVPLDVQHQLIFQLESEFPFLRLCANHWKSMMVATNSYSQWYRLACSRRVAAGAKGKAKDVDLVDADGQESFKQPQVEENDTRPSKRTRLEEPKPIAPSRPPPTQYGRRKVCGFFFLFYMRC